MGARQPKNTLVKGRTATARGIRIQLAAMLTTLFLPWFGQYPLMAQMVTITVPPISITQPCCEPAVFYCVGVGKTLGWNIKLPLNSNVTAPSFPITEDGEVRSSHYTIPTKDEDGGFNGLSLSCYVLSKGALAESDVVTLTIERGPSTTTKNLRFSETLAHFFLG